MRDIVIEIGITQVRIMAIMQLTHEPKTRAELMGVWQTLENIVRRLDGP